LLEKITINTSEWFCNFAGNMILVQNSTCLSPSLPSGSNQLSIVNMQQVFGSVSIFAIPNKINSLSSSVLLSHRNHSLKVVLTHPLSGFNFHLIVGLDQYPCFPASKYEKLGYISFTCVVQTSEPGQMFVKLCGAYCTSESAVLVEESPVVTISSEKCFVGDCVIKVFGHPICQSFNMISYKSLVSQCSFILGDSMENSSELHRSTAFCVFHHEIPGNITVSLRCGNASFYDTVVRVQEEWSLYPKFALVGFLGIPQNISFVGTSVLQTHLCQSTTFLFCL